MALLGYRYGLQQPGRKKTLSFAVPDAEQTDQFDAWLAQALNTDPASYTFQIRCSVQGCESALRYLSRVLLTATELLQDMRVPLFERAVLESIHQQGGRAQARLWMPYPQGMDVEVVDLWLRQATVVLARFSATFQDDEAREVAYKAFNTQQIQPWRQRIPGAQSTIPVLQSASHEGITFAHVGAGRYVLGWGASSLIVDRSANSGDSAIGAAISQNKANAVELMRSAGIPTPRGVLMRQAEFAPEKMARLRLPWVIKPVDRDRGEGVTLNIQTIEEAKAAFAVAASLSKGILAEEQVPGICHRILVIDQQVIYAVKRNPKTVVGDGTHSIAELMSLENAALRRMLPSKRLPEYTLDDDVRAHLARAKLLPESVPKPGVRVSLRAAQSTRWGGDPQDVTQALHPENVAIAVKAAQLFRLRCAGVDFISEDISVPWFLNGAVINELNYSPVIGRTHDYQRRAAASYVKALFPAKGRIPIEVFLGRDQADLVDERRAHWQSLNMTVKLCSDASDSGQPVFQTIASTRFDPSLQVLLVHLERDESFAWDSLPFPWVTRIHVSPSIATAFEKSPLGQALAFMQRPAPQADA